MEMSTGTRGPIDLGKTIAVLAGLALLAGFTPAEATPQPRVFAKGWVTTDRLGCELPTGYEPPDQFGWRFRVIDVYPFREVAPRGVHTVYCDGPGQYRVRLRNLGVQGGVAHVTANEDDHNHDCKIGLWLPEGPDLIAYVNCFALDGRPEDSKFHLFFYKDTERGSAIDGNAYLWATPTVAPAAYQFNSRGGANSALRTGRGEYLVRLPLMQRDPRELDKPGSILVTAHGFGAGRCKLREPWTEAAGTVSARVACFHPNGAPLDSAFTLSFLRAPGTPAAATSTDHVEAFYVMVGGFGVSVLSQSDSYGASTASVERGGGSSVGAYRVFLPGVKSSDETTAQVVAIGADDRRCTISAIVDQAGLTEVDVHCFGRDGRFADSNFALYYETDRGILF
jgi:hypothetical protein